MDRHAQLKAEFELLVLKRFGQEAAGAIDWSAPRLLCLAEYFTRYDAHAVQQMNRSIELIRYICFGKNLLLLDLVNVVSASPDGGKKYDNGSGGATPKQQYTTQEEYLEKASPELKELFEIVRKHILDLGDDVQERFLKWYIAYKQIRNFATVQLQTQKNGMLMWLPLDPDSVPIREQDEGFLRDVRGVGHHGTGDLEITIRSVEDFERAKPLIARSFDQA